MERGLHGRILDVYKTKFLRTFQKNEEALIKLIIKGNDFNNPDIDPGGNFKNKTKYFKKEYATRVADRLHNTFTKEFRPENSGLDILDVGCGFGQYSLIFKEFGHRPIGTLGGSWYIDDYKFFLQKLGLNFHEVDILNMAGFYSDLNVKFDIIFCSETLTLPSLESKIHEITHQFLDLIKPCGRIIILNHHNKNVCPTMEVYN